MSDSLLNEETSHSYLLLPVNDQENQGHTKNQTSGTKNYRLYYATFVSTISTFLFGYNSGNVASAIFKIKKEFGMGDVQSGFLVAIILISAAGGAMASGSIVDKFGRKKAILSTNIFYIIGPIIMVLSHNFYVLILGRFLTGISLGLSMSSVSLYLSEISPANLRGVVGLLRQLSVTFGIFFSYLMGLWLLKYTWRILVGVGVIPCIVQLAASPFLVESPRWLVQNSQDEKALENITLMDVSLEGQTDKAYKIIEEIKKSISQSKVSGGGWNDIFQARFTKVIVISVFLNIFQQITGINTVQFYSPTILIEAGFSESNSVLYTVLVAAPQLIVLFSLIWWVEKVKRRTLFMFGLSLGLIGIFFLGLGFFDPVQIRLAFTSEGIPSIYKPDLKGAFRYFSVLGMLVFRTSFALGLGHLPQTIATEILPSKIRGKATALSGMVNWTCNFIVSLTFLPLVSRFGATLTFWAYGVLIVVCLLFIILIVPETKGVSLEELEKRLIKNNETENKPLLS